MDLQGIGLQMQMLVRGAHAGVAENYGDFSQEVDGSEDSEPLIDKTGKETIGGSFSVRAGAVQRELLKRPYSDNIAKHTDK